MKYRLCLALIVTILMLCGDLHAVCGGVGEPACNVMIDDTTGPAAESWIDGQISPGNYGALDVEILAARSELDLTYDTARIQMNDVFAVNLNEASGLPCFGPWLINGKSYDVCFSQFSEELNMVGMAVLFISTFLSIKIVFLS